MGVADEMYKWIEDNFVHKDDLRKLVEEIDRRGFAAVGNSEAQNAWGWCSIKLEELIGDKDAVDTSE